MKTNTALAIRVTVALLSVATLTMAEPATASARSVSATVAKLMPLRRLNPQPLPPVRAEPSESIVIL
jgi:hypothetical protein